MDADARELDERLAAVERAVIDGPDGGDGGAVAVDSEPDSADVEDRLAVLEARVDELDAAVQAVRGYVGGVDAVDGAVERRANLALAKAERLESDLLDEPGLSVERLPEGDGESDVADPDPGTDEPAWTPDDEEERTLADRLRDAL